MERDYFNCYSILPSRTAYHALSVIDDFLRAMNGSGGSTPFLKYFCIILITFPSSFSFLSQKRQYVIETFPNEPMHKHAL